MKYIAGLLDGEGCITIHVNRARDASFWNQSPRVVMQVIVTNNYRPVLRKLQRQFGGSLRSHPHRYNPRAATSYFWSLSEQAGAKFLRRIFPYLEIKKRQAHLYLQLAALKARNATKGSRKRRLSKQDIARRLRIATRCSELNKRGRQ